MKKHFSILFFIYITIVFFCNYTLGIFHLTDVDYHKSFDTYSYVDATKLFLNHFQVHEVRCFGYPLLLALPYYFFKLTPAFFWLVYIFQNVLLLLSFSFIYKIIAFYTTERKAFWTVFLLMINVTYIVFTFHVLTEIGFLFLMISAFYCIHLFQQQKKNAYLWLSFLAICIATLFKPGLLYFNLLVGFCVAFYFLVKKKNSVSFFVLVFIFLSTIGFQAYKMNQQFGMYKISFIDDVTMYRYLNTAVQAKINAKDKLYLMGERDSALAKQLIDVDNKNVYKVQHEIVKKETSYLIKNHPTEFFTVFGENLLENFHTGNSFVRDMSESNVLTLEVRKRLFDYTRIWNMLCVIMLLCMNLFFVFQFVRKKINWTNPTFLSFILLFYCNYSFITVGISYFQGDRFNVVWMPMLFILVVINWAMFYKKSVE